MSNENRMEIELSKIVKSPHQVRTITTDEELWELAESINGHGLLQPIKVRPTERGHELVYRHRRVAAMRLLGWTKCEAIVEGVTDEDSLVQSIAETLQRQNLGILDEARSYQILIERGYTLKEIAELVKKPQRAGKTLSFR
jgi:ParB family chromosome partitioning protein